MSAATPAAVRRDSLRVELEWTRAEFTSMLRQLSDDDLRRPSANPAWTNSEALWHIALGLVLLPALARMIRFWALFPEGSSGPFIRLLNAVTPLFNRVNSLGPRVAARIYRGRGLARRFDRAYAKSLRMLASLDERDLDRGMRFPDRWDAVYGDHITMEQLFRLPASHLRSHLPVIRATGPARER